MLDWICWARAQAGVELLGGFQGVTMLILARADSSLANHSAVAPLQARVHPRLRARASVYFLNEPFLFGLTNDHVILPVEKKHPKRIWSLRNAGALATAAGVDGKSYRYVFERVLSPLIPARAVALCNRRLRWPAHRNPMHE